MRTLLENATLVDGSGARPVPASAVLLEGERIEAVGRAGDFGRPETDLRRIDLTGKYLLPGFVNVHDHLTNKRIRGSRAEKHRTAPEMLVAIGVRSALLNLREGVTTVRDLGSRDGLNRVVKAALDDGTFVGPDVVVCPRALTVTAGYSCINGIEVDTVAEARKAAGRLVKDGCEWIKCMASIEWERADGEPLSAVNMDTELMKAAFDLAHHHGKRCAAHAIHDDAIAGAVEAGADSIEHGLMLTRRTAERLARRGTVLVPTFSGYLQHCNDWGRGAGVVRHGELLKPYHRSAYRHAVEAGVRIAYGSDTLGNLAEEAAAMQEHGASAMDCIVAATRTGAELLGMADVVGTVAAGKRADLVVLNSDPLARPAAFLDIDLVFRSGRMFHPAQIPI